MCRSALQIALSVTLTIASWGLIISGSGTRFKRTWFFPSQHNAFIVSRRELPFDRLLSLLDFSTQLLQLVLGTIFLGELEDLSFLFLNVMIDFIYQRFYLFDKAGV